MFSLGENRAQRRREQRAEQKLTEKFRRCLEATVKRHTVPHRQYIEIRESIIPRGFFLGGDDGRVQQRINPFLAPTYAEEAYVFLFRLGWRLRAKRFWFFTYPDEIADAIAHALERWHYGDHADRIDIAAAQEWGFPCTIDGFKRAAEGCLMLLWVSRITFERKA